MNKTSWIVIAVIVVVLAGAALIAKQWKGGSASEGRSAIVTLEPLNNSGERGTATISEMNGQVKVVLKVQNAPAGTEQPAHIHLGACPNPGDVKYPLVAVTNGISETIINVPIDDIMKNLPLAVNVHKSREEARTYVACGNIAAF